MLIHYLKITIRFIGRNLAFTLINLLGLSTGIAAFLLISLYLQNELGFDKDAPNASKMYRLVGIQEPAGLDPQQVAITSAVFAPHMIENFPQVEDAFRIMHSSSLIMVDEKSFRGGVVYHSEGNVISQMGYPVLYGDAQLNQPNQSAISRISAERFFNTADVVGKTFRVSDHLYTITAVYEHEHINSHLKTDVFLSFTTVENDSPWLKEIGNNTLTTYVVLKNPANRKVTEDHINEFYRNHMDENPNVMKNTFYLQRYNDIYLRSGDIKFYMFTNVGNINNVYIFSIVALLVIAIASINFVNLATANSARRAKEVGLRKLFGADRSKLAAQFIGESLMITLISIIVALGLTELLLPEFNSLLGTDLRIDFMGNVLFNAGLLFLWMAVGLISGFYPALYLSRFDASSVMRAGNGSGKPRTTVLRKILVTFQFAISTAMILATLVVIFQVSHMKKKDLGYNRQNVITVFANQTRDYEKLKGFRDRLLMLPEVQSAGISSGYNGVAGRQSMIETADSVPTRLMVRYGYVDPGFFPAMEMRLAEGRNFSYDFTTDPNRTIIINKAAQRALGWENPIGKHFKNDDNPYINHYTVIGVIEDYHYFSLHNPIEPAVYIWNPGEMRVINLRYQTSDAKSLTAKIANEHEEYFPGIVFSSEYLENLIERQYRSESNTMQIFIRFAMLCILISCLGLFGLTWFMVNQRRKEISIRKILGGSTLKINFLLLQNFLKLIAIAAAVALPLTFMIMNNWLNNFAYHITIGFEHILITLLIITWIATSTILALTTRAALRNPADNIKYE
jgi:putative ABC transport system permease protein